MSVDINLLEFNQSFLKKLQSDRNVSVSDIKLKFKGFLKPSTYTRLYQLLDSITNTHPDVKLPYAQRKCLYGDMSQIEEIVITNKNFPFFNEFHVYNITGTIRIVDKVQFNGLNKDFYTTEIERYKKLLISIFSNYIGSWNEYKKRMDECYVVECYVDKYYNCPDDIDKDVEQDTFVYPDLFIDAGPNHGEGGFSLWIQQSDLPYQTFGATFASAPGAEVKWTVSNPLVIIVDDTATNPLIDYDGELPPGYTTFTMTLTVTYPWGPVLTDSKTVKYFATYSFNKFKPPGSY